MGFIYESFSISSNSLSLDVMPTSTINNIAITNSNPIK